MNGVIVSGTTNSVIFDLNDYQNLVGFKRVIRRKDHFIRVQMEFNYIIYTTSENITYKLDFTHVNGNIKVHSINGVAPTSLDHLWDLIVGILA